jgi:hypothetical protein
VSKQWKWFGDKVELLWRLSIPTLAVVYELPPPLPGKCPALSPRFSYIWKEYSWTEACAHATSSQRVTMDMHAFCHFTHSDSWCAYNLPLHTSCPWSCTRHVGEALGYFCLHSGLLLSSPTHHSANPFPDHYPAPLCFWVVEGPSTLSISV